MSESSSSGSSVVKIVLGVLAGGCLLAVAGIGGCFVLAGSAAHEAHQQQQAQLARLEAAPISDVSWEEIDRVYNVRSSSTELQKKERWKNYEGRKVRWTGTVSSVGETLGSMSLQLKLNPGTLTSDVLVRLKPTQRDRALQLSEGAVVTVVGVLDDWGTLLPVTLDHGVIE